MLADCAACSSFHTLRQGGKRAAAQHTLAQRCATHARTSFSAPCASNLHVLDLDEVIIIRIGFMHAVSCMRLLYRALNSRFAGIWTFELQQHPFTSTKHPTLITMLYIGSGWCMQCDRQDSSAACIVHKKFIPWYMCPTPQDEKKQPSCCWAAAELQEASDHTWT
jgi:hypothetical protein